MNDNQKSLLPYNENYVLIHKTTLVIFLIEQAEKRMLMQTPESMDKLIQEYFIGRQNKVKSIVVGMPRTA